MQESVAMYPSCTSRPSLGVGGSPPGGRLPHSKSTGLGSVVACVALLALPARVGAAQAPVGPGTSAGIRHEMILVDESRTQLLYVNQHEPKRNWTVKMPVVSTALTK